MRRLGTGLSICLIVLPLLAACQDERVEQVEQVEGESGEEQDVKEDFLITLRSDLVEYNRKVEELRERAEGAAAGEELDLIRAIEDVEAKLRAFKEDVDRLPDTAGEVWETRASEARTALKELEASYRAAEARFP